MGFDYAAERVVHDRRVGFGLGEDRMRRRRELSGGDGVLLGVGDGGRMLGVSRAHRAGRTSRAWSGVLCIGARISLIELRESDKGSKARI